MVSVAPISYNNGQQFEGMRTTSARREKVEDVASTGGAAVAGGAAGKSVWKHFNSASKVGKISKETQAAIKTTAQVADKANTLWSAFRSNVSKFTRIAKDFGEGFQSTPIISKLLKSKAYKSFTAGFGYLMAGFVLLSGISKTISVAVAKTNVN